MNSPTTSAWSAWKRPKHSEKQQKQHYDEKLFDFAGRIRRRPSMRRKRREPTSRPPGRTPPPAESSPAGTIPDAAHKPVLTTNTVTIAGQSVNYTAETGMLPLLKSDGASRASVFYVAYTRLGETNAAARPVMLCFNGGPGSSSVWLHLGALGPRRVKMNDDGTLPRPALRPDGQRVFHSGPQRLGFH